MSEHSAYSHPAALMNEATWQFVRSHADDDVRQLALRGVAGQSQVNLAAALQQIQGQQTARRKLPSWAACSAIMYPPHLSMEQCSSEATARYKVRVLSEFLKTHGATGTTVSEAVSAAQPAAVSTLIDLTGGLGVDFSFLAQLFQQAVYVERQTQLCALARHNFVQLGLLHAQVVEADAADYLAQLQQKQQASLPEKLQAPLSEKLPAPLPEQRQAITFFIDPARRDTHGARTYGIADCTPNVLHMLPVLLSTARCVLLKLSPMLDWRKTVADLGAQYVRQLHIVAVDGECKELLVLLSAAGTGFRLFCTNDDEQLEIEQSVTPHPSPITQHSSSLTPLNQRLLATVGVQQHSAPTTLYLPNAALMKAGCFDFIASKYGVEPLAANSHLFVSQQPVPHFPGRSFSIQAVTTLNKKELRTALQGISQANISVRNFPLTAQQLRARLKLADGGHHYIIGTTLATGIHVLLICERC